MTKARTVRIASPAMKAVPQRKEDASEAMADLGAAAADKKRIQGEVDAAVAKITAAFEPKMRGAAERFEAAKKGLATWAEANKGELTASGGRTVNLGTGEISWRFNPMKVKVSGLDKVLEVLKAKKLFDFIRTKEELDKNAILKAPEAVKGVKGIELVQDETLYLKPSGIDMEEIAC